MAELANLLYSEVVAAGPGWTKVRTADGQVVTVEGNRNWRNNNPGNIEYGDFAKSHGAIGTDGRFAVFPSYDAGRDAKSSLIFESPNYRNLSLSGAINRYAPPFENNTKSYLDQVAAAAGVSINTPMNQIPADRRAAILDAMQRVEGWKVGKVNGSQIPIPPANLQPAVPAPVRMANVALPRPRPGQPARLPMMSYAGMETPRQTRLPPIPPSSALGAIQTAAPAGARPGSPGWWGNPLGAARTAVGGLGIGGLIAAPNMQRSVGNALMSTPSGSGIVLRQVLNGNAQAPVTAAPQVTQQQTYNPSNHSAAQMAAVAAGRSTYTGSDGGLQPTHAMNGNLRYTY